MDKFKMCVDYMCLLGELSQCCSFLLQCRISLTSDVLLTYTRSLQLKRICKIIITAAVK